MKERIMTFASTTLAALSIAAVAAVAISIEPAAVGTSAETASAAKSEYLILAGGRRGKCTEDLGYGRTSNWGCG
jgi:hypothetical protein